MNELHIYYAQKKGCNTHILKLYLIRRIRRPRRTSSWAGQLVLG
jgi:tRNA(Glu) U13 pseudouridine synthase TruD